MNLMSDAPDSEKLRAIHTLVTQAWAQSAADEYTDTDEIWGTLQTIAKIARPINPRNRARIKSE